MQNGNPGIMQNPPPMNQQGFMGGPNQGPGPNQQGMRPYMMMQPMIPMQMQPQIPQQQVSASSSNETGEGSTRTYTQGTPNQPFTPQQQLMMVMTPAGPQLVQLMAPSFAQRPP